jgi:transcription termination factor NusA
MTDRSDKTPQDLFIRVLQVKPECASILVMNGFTTLEEIAYVPIEELSSIDGLDERQIQLAGIGAPLSSRSDS